MVERNNGKAPWLKLACYGTELQSAKNTRKTTLEHHYRYSTQERALKKDIKFENSTIL